MTRRLSALLALMIALAANTAPGNLDVARPARALALASCDQSPTRPLAKQMFDLDHVAEDWGVFCEPSPITGGFATWSKQNIASPSIDGEALECGISGGAPYSNIHCYRNVAAPTTSTVAVTLTLSFQLLPGPTCADGQTACVQALEFSISRWQKGQRYEWALQWQNVGGPCPRWRYWDPGHPGGWVALDPPEAQTLQAGRWYKLTLAGEIWQAKVRYVGFEISEPDAPAHSYFFGPLDIQPVGASPNLNLLAAAVQLDGRYDQAPYRAVLDQVGLRQADQPGFLGLPQRTYLPLLHANTATAPSDGCA